MRVLRVTKEAGKVALAVLAATAFYLAWLIYDDPQVFWEWLVGVR